MALSLTASEIQRLIGRTSQIFPTSVFFTALGRDDRIRISRKALRILAVESFADLIVKFRDPGLRRLDRTAGCDRQTDGRTDGRLRQS